MLNIETSISSLLLFVNVDTSIYQCASGQYYHDSFVTILSIDAITKQVWRIDAEGKIPLTGSSLSKFFSGDCYIFQYTYPGELGDQYLVGTWFGEQSVEVMTVFNVCVILDV